MFFNKTTEDAVSPVVGVILMVAVTVILAAVIGSFVLDLGSNVSANPSAGVTFSQDAADGTVSVQAISMENADSLEVRVSNTSVTGHGSTISSVGATQVIGVDDDAASASGDLENGDQITVIGSLDGKEAVLQTYTYDA